MTSGRLLERRNRLEVDDLWQLSLRQRAVGPQFHDGDVICEILRVGMRLEPGSQEVSAEALTEASQALQIHRRIA